MESKVGECPVRHGTTCPRRDSVTTEAGQHPVGDLGVTKLKVDVAKGNVPEQRCAIGSRDRPTGVSLSARHRSCHALIQASVSSSVSSRRMCHCWMLGS